MYAPPTLDRPTFEQSYPEVARIVQSRRGAWTYLSLMEWSDVSAILVEHIWKKWGQYDPTKGPLENWANTLITGQLFNLRRNLLLRYSRPCLKGCVHNIDNTGCEVTPSRTQCDECPLYAEWARTRQHQLHIKSTVALDNHAQEVHSRQEDFCDIEGIKRTIDEQMRANLTRWEYRLYVLLYVRHLKPAEAGAQLEALVKTWKRAPREDEVFTYQFILAKQRWFKELMFDVLKREGYDLQAFLDYAS